MTHRHHLNLDAIQAFAAFADSLNFSTAAESLHISQPALHTKIRKLAGQLDVSLYTKIGRGLRLTPQGESVARFGRELSARTQRFFDTLDNHENQAVSLAAGEGAYTYLLGTGIKACLQTPGAKLSLLTADRDRSIQLVREGRATFGIAPLEVIPADMDATVYTAVGQVLVVPRTHPLARRKTLKLKDLAGSQLVVPPEGRPQRQMISHLLQSGGIPWSIAVEASGWELMMRLVQTGIGIAIVNAYCRIPKGLKAIPIPELPKLHYHIFRMHGAMLQPSVHQLMNILKQHADDWKSGN